MKAKQNMNGNILNREFNPKHFGQAYVTDISYFKVSEGWLFLSAIKDLYNGEIEAWKCSCKCDAVLATETLKQLREQKHFTNVIMHSDLGSTYVSRMFLEECQLHGFVKSLKSQRQLLGQRLHGKFFWHGKM